MEAFVWLHQTANLLSQQTDVLAAPAELLQPWRWTHPGPAGPPHLQREHIQMSW